MSDPLDIPHQSALAMSGKEEPMPDPKPKMPRLVQAWPKESLHSRLHICVSTLNVFGMLTDAETAKVRMRIRKAAEKGEFHA